MSDEAEELLIAAADVRRKQLAEARRLLSIAMGQTGQERYQASYIPYDGGQALLTLLKQFPNLLDEEPCTSEYEELVKILWVLASARALLNRSLNNPALRKINDI